jgi:hypothetical protein
MPNKVTQTSRRKVGNRREERKEKARAGMPVLT